MTRGLQGSSADPAARYADLARASNPPLPGNRNRLWCFAWYVVSTFLFEGPVHLPYAVKAAVLRMFGARVGHGLVVKPRVRIKYPWFLVMGDHVWLGEEVWIDSLGPVTLGSDICVSQGAYLCTGNHDWRDPRFTRFLRPIEVHDQAWIGARAILCPGATIGRGAVLAAGTVLAGSAQAGMIYRGNPAACIGPRSPGRSGQLGR